MAQTDAQARLGTDFLVEMKQRRMRVLYTEFLLGIVLSASLDRFGFPFRGSEETATFIPRRRGGCGAGVHFLLPEQSDLVLALMTSEVPSSGAAVTRSAAMCFLSPGRMAMAC